MSMPLTREIAELFAAMQVKALAFDAEHPQNPLGTNTAADYARAIKALVPEQHTLGAGMLMAEASKRALHTLMLAQADCGPLM